MAPTTHFLGTPRVRPSLKAKVRHHPVLEILEKERPEAVAETADRALNGEPRAVSPVHTEVTLIATRPQVPSGSETPSSVADRL